MRAFIIIVVVAVLGFFGYEYFGNGRTPGEAIAELTGAADAARAEAEAQAAAAAAAAAEVAAAAEAKAAEEAAAAEAAAAEAQAAAEALAAEEAAAAAAAVTEATDNAAAAVTEATDNALSAVENAVEGAAAAVDEATPTEPVATESDAAGIAADNPLLTPEGFNAEGVIGLISGSNLSDVQKTALTAAVNAAKDNPELLQATLTRLREALGL